MPRATGKPTCYDKPQVSSMFRLAMKRVAQEREARSAAGERFDKTDERDVFEAQLLSVFCADEKLQVADNWIAWRRTIYGAMRSTA